MATKATTDQIWEAAHRHAKKSPKLYGNLKDSFRAGANWYASLQQQDTPPQQLKPLSEISDEDAIEVAKIAYGGSGSWQQGKGILNYLLTNPKAIDLSFQSKDILPANGLCHQSFNYEPPKKESMNMNPNKYKVDEFVYIVSDDCGYNHGVGDGRRVEIHLIYPVPEENTYEYEVMDENGDFWHIPENDLSKTPNQ